MTERNKISYLAIFMQTPYDSGSAEEKCPILHVSREYKPVLVADHDMQCIEPAAEHMQAHFKFVITIRL